MVREFFTSRSEGNLALHVGDDHERVLAARAALAQRLSLPVSNVKYMNQVHGNTVAIVDATSGEPTADALITTDRSVALAVLVADCLPVLLRTKNVIGVIHAGRAGIVQRVIPHTIEAVRSRDSSPISIVIGPAICGRCYEVSPEIYHEVTSQVPATATHHESSHSKNCLDLRAGARAQCEEYGITPTIVEKCTQESADLFSYRASKVTGRQAGVISWQ